MTRGNNVKTYYMNYCTIKGNYSGMQLRAI